MHFLKLLLVSNFTETLSVIPQTGWHINNINLFLTVLEAGMTNIKVPKDSASGENLLSGSQMASFLLCPHMVEGRKELSGSLL